MSGKVFLAVWALCTAGVYGWLYYQGLAPDKDMLEMGLGSAVVGLLAALLVAGLVKRGG